MVSSRYVLQGFVLNPGQCVDIPFKCSVSLVLISSLRLVDFDQQLICVVQV